VVAEELDEARILTTDQRDFNIYRFHTVKVFNNILLGVAESRYESDRNRNFPKLEIVD
jgi:hypothetical protein